MTWELREVGDIECTLDGSGIYVVIHRVVEKLVHKGIAGEIIRIRADVMTDGGEPLVSFIGRADNVRKAVVRWLNEQCYFPSLEHASYIGWELHRAETDPNFVQD